MTTLMPASSIENMIAHFRAAVERQPTGALTVSTENMARILGHIATLARERDEARSKALEDALKAAEKIRERAEADDGLCRAYDDLNGAALARVAEGVAFQIVSRIRALKASP